MTDILDALKQGSSQTDPQAPDVSGGDMPPASNPPSQVSPPPEPLSEPADNPSPPPLRVSEPVVVPTPPPVVVEPLAQPTVPPTDIPPAPAPVSPLPPSPVVPASLETPQSSVVIPPPAKKGSMAKNVILAIILLLAITIPIGAWYTSQSKQVAEVRSIASQLNCQGKDASGQTRQGECIPNGEDCSEVLSNDNCPAYKICCTIGGLPTNAPPLTNTPPGGSGSCEDQGGELCDIANPSSNTCRQNSHDPFYDELPNQWCCAAGCKVHPTDNLDQTPTPGGGGGTCNLSPNASDEFCVGNNPYGACYLGGSTGKYWCQRLSGNLGKKVIGSTDCTCPNNYSWGPRVEYGNTWCFNTTRSPLTCDPYADVAKATIGGKFTGEMCGVSEGQLLATCETPTPPGNGGNGGSCESILVYDAGGVNITQALISGTRKIVIGETLTLATPKGNADKARFRIQGITNFTENDPSLTTSTEYRLRIIVPSTITQSQGKFEVEVNINGDWR